MLTQTRKYPPYKLGKPTQSKCASHNGAKMRRIHK